ncbi:MAG: catalase HPII, partial [Chloroflexi bacterium]
TASIMYDAVFIPGGEKHAQTLKMQGDALHFVNEAFKHGKAIGATGAGIELLIQANLQGVALAGPQTEEELVSDKGIVTSRDGNSLNGFSKTFIQAIAQHRHWNRETKEQVPA